MLSKQSLEEFKRIWEEKYGEKISDDFALEQAVNLLTLFNVVFRPLKKEWIENKSEGNKQI